MVLNCYFSFYSRYKKMFVEAFSVFIGLLVIRFLYKFIFDEPSLKKFNYPFEEPGILYWINYALYRIALPILYRRRNRLNKFGIDPKHATGNNLYTTDEQHSLEMRQKGHQATDEIRIGGFDIRHGHWLDLSISCNPGSETGRCWVYFVLNSPSGKRFYSLPRSPQTLYRSAENRDNCWQGDDLKLWCMEPMTKWRILFNGFLKDENSGSIDHVKFSFIWRPFTSTLDHAEFVSNSALADALARSSESYPMSTIRPILNQYDQWGSHNGFYSINDEEETPLVLRGNKTHHVGTFKWSEVHRLIDIKAYFEDGTVVSINAISLKTGVIREMLWGYVELCGSVTNSIKSSDFSFPMIQSDEEFPSLFSIRLQTDGEEFVVTLATDSQPKSNVWGSTKWPSIDVSVTGIRASLTNLTQNLKKQGRGTIHFAKGRDIVREEPTSFAEPLLHPVNIDDAKKLRELVLEFSDNACSDGQLTGGKGSSLAMLQSISSGKFEVPSGFCVTIHAYQRHVDAQREIKMAIKRVVDICCQKIDGDVQQATEELQKLFLESKVSPELRQSVHEVLVKLFGESYDSERFAIRSSASGEDGKELSGAGQMESFLGCKGLDQICDAIVKCWMSLYARRAVEYRHVNGQIIDVGMAVVVQKMVAADVAGIIFTRHPTTGNPGIMTISANSGLGESVVSAGCDPDAINVTRTHNDELSIGNISLGKKEVKVVMNDDNGIETVDTSEGSSECCLTVQQALQLAEVGVYVEHSYGDPRDVEWAFCKGKLHLLQARPITSLDRMSDLEHMVEFSMPLMTDMEQINSGNVKEVVPGAMSPIMSSYGMERMSESLAMSLDYLSMKPTKAHPEHKKIFSNHLWHCFMNRLELSYSINQKNRTLADIQTSNGFDIAVNGRTFDNDDMREIGSQRSRYASRYLSWRNSVTVMLHLLQTKRTIKKMKETFGDLDLYHAECRNAKELANRIFAEPQYWRNSLCQHAAVTLSSVIMNSFVFVELVKNKIEITNEHYGDFATLMSTESHTNAVVSADVPTALKELAKTIKKTISPEKFSSMSKKEALDWLNSADGPVRSEFQDFLEKHGHRCIKEFDWLSKTWSMDPTQLIDPLKALLNTVEASSVTKLTVDQALDRLKTKLGYFQRKKLRKVVLTAREYVAAREQAKSLLVRTIHEYRKEFVRLGTMMVNEGRISDPQLLMFMTHVEVYQLIATRSPVIIQRAMARRKLLPCLDKLKFTEVNYGYPKPIDTRAPMTTDGSITISGTPVSKGIVEGTARVVMEIGDAGCIQPGDILITAATDIAWSPYFPSLSGVVTELGGLISHGAVVAREYGIPCIVGAENATGLFKSGDIVRLNGSIGKLEKLSDS